MVKVHLPIATDSQMLRCNMPHSVRQVAPSSTGCGLTSGPVLKHLDTGCMPVKRRGLAKSRK
jgi:hypothetical protein